MDCKKIYAVIIFALLPTVFFIVGCRNADYTIYPDSLKLHSAELNRKYEEDVRKAYNQEFPSGTIEYIDVMELPSGVLEADVHEKPSKSDLRECEVKIFQKKDLFSSWEYIGIGDSWAHFDFFN